MSECEKCHGKGAIPCSTCKGKKTEPCKKCDGTGKVLCNRCSGDGEITCEWCHGSGTVTEWKTCPVCYHGKVTKTRVVNCGTCHATGMITDEYYRISEHRKVYKQRTCHYCGGSGQVKEEYDDICPNCHGDYRKSTEKTCSHCHGRGYFKCDTKCGSHKKKIECNNCDGTGQVICSHCKGDGKVKCPDCEKREQERKEREAAQKKRQEEQKQRKEEQERKAEEKRRREAAEKERAQKAAQQRAKERKEQTLGCSCLLAIVAIVGFFIWWWVEGFTMSALSGMWEQTKNALGGAGGIAKVIGGLVALFLGWKVIAAIKRKSGGSEASTSDKKRWKFVVLGILFGFLGLHLAYAKRWTLFLLLWAGLITGGSFGTSSEAAKSPDAPAPQVTQTEQPKSNDNMISNIGFAVWGLLWIGGTLFIKKDGKGNRM